LQKPQGLDLERPNIAEDAIIGGRPLHAQAVDQVGAALPGKPGDPAERQQFLVRERGIDPFDVRYKLAIQG
jgi:hypothetical protein